MISRRNLLKGGLGLVGVGLLTPPTQLVTGAEAVRRYWQLDRSMLGRHRGRASFDYLSDTIVISWSYNASAGKGVVGSYRGEIEVPVSLSLRSEIEESLPNLDSLTLDVEQLVWTTPPSPRWTPEFPKPKMYVNGEPIDEVQFTVKNRQIFP